MGRFSPIGPVLASVSDCRQLKPSTSLSQRIGLILFGRTERSHDVSSNRDLIDEYRAGGRFVATPGRNVFLRDEGAGSPVLFLHGIPTYSYLWRHVVAEVAPRHRTLAPDLPGFGLSEKRSDWDYSASAQADTIRSLLLQLEIDRLAIVSHDFGALIASELISRAPELFTHVVILNTSLHARSWSGGLSPLSLLRIPVAGELAMTFSRQWMLTRAMRMYVECDERLTPDVMGHYWWPFEHGFRGTLLSMSRQQDGNGRRFRALARRVGAVGSTEPDRLGRQ